MQESFLALWKNADLHQELRYVPEGLNEKEKQMLEGLVII
jgi:hypothetical protein